MPDPGIAALGPVQAIAVHWHLYASEGALLGMFMAVACITVVAVHHPTSWLAKLLRTPMSRRVVVGVIMGATAIGLIYSPWGQRSGAHLNPATTLAFLTLGKVKVWDAFFYVLAQFSGGILGVKLCAVIMPHRLSHAAVGYAATRPGRHGPTAAWCAEYVIALVMMTVVLVASNAASTAPFTGVMAGALVAVFIVVESPLSGMSMNPARTLGSAFAARDYRGLWIYFTAPPIGMLCAAMAFAAIAGSNRVHCAKLNHSGGEPCHFRCSIHLMRAADQNP